MNRAPEAVPTLAPTERIALVEQRLQAVAELLARHGAHGVLLSSRRDFAWLTLGGLNHVVLASEAGAAPVLVTQRRAIVLAPVNEASRIADEELAGLPLTVEEVPWWDPGAAAGRAAEHVGRGRLIDESMLRDELTALRERLVPAEHARLAWLGQLVRSVVDTTLAACEAGTTEEQVAAAALAALAEAGARGPVLLVAADERIELYRHPLPTQKRLARRVMLVVVAERWGLHAALTGFRELEAPSPETRRRSDAVDQVLAAMREATQRGSTLGDVVRRAQAAYTALGFADEWRLHHQGGTIGYQGRERIASADDRTEIVPGMAFAWNPSVAGAKAEETLYLDLRGALRVVTG